MSDKIRVGIIGASKEYGWGGRAHVPAIQGLPEYEIIGVATSRKETSEKTRKLLGAKYAYSNYGDLVENPEVDVVSVCVKAPLHYEMTIAALKAGKSVFTEWPLGTNALQAKEMSSLAKEKNLPCIVGLQARASPGILHIKELVESGYVGTPLSCSMNMFLTTGLKSSSSVWGGDRKNGANTLTIPSGHSIDALCYCLGDFAELSSYVQTQSPTWHLEDTNEDIAIDAPDNVLVNGILNSGCLASIHIASTASPAPGWRMQIYGTEGSLIATSTLMLQYGDIKLMGARRQSDIDTYKYVGEDAFEPIEIPSKHVKVPSSIPSGWPFNIAQLYRRLSDHILNGKPARPNFDDALKHHSLLETIETAANSRRIQVVV